MKITTRPAMNAGMTRNALSLAILFAVSATACGPSVVVADPRGSGGASAAGGGGLGSRAVAWRERDSPLRPSAAVGTGGEYPADDAIHVYIASEPVSCGNPWIGDCGNATRWELDFSIQPGDQHPGALGLGSTTFAMFEWTDAENPDPNVIGCNGGESLGLAGSVQIMSIDATSVTLRFSGVNAGEGAPDLSSLGAADIVVPRCM